MLKLRDILRPEALLDDLKGTDKRAVLSEFSQLGHQLLKIDQDAILNVLLEREKLGSTAVGHGVAIPHGKITGLPQMTALFGRSKKGVDFQAHDQKLSQLFFVILAPESAIGNYLHALARLSRLMKDERVRAIISKCEMKDLYQTLLAEDDKI